MGFSQDVQFKGSRNLFGSRLVVMVGGTGIYGWSFPLSRSLSSPFLFLFFLSFLSTLAFLLSTVAGDFSLLSPLLGLGGRVRLRLVGQRQRQL